MRCLRLKNEKISKSIADMQIILFLGKNIRLRLLFLIIRFITRLKFILEFEVEVEKFISFWVTFFKKTPKFSTFFSNISKRKLIMKDLITTYEEEIQSFFASRLICVHRLKWVRKLNIYINFLVIFEIGAKNAQKSRFYSI